MTNPLFKESEVIAESSNILVSHEAAAVFVDRLFMGQDSNEYRAADTLHNFCTATFPNCLTLILLSVYRCSIRHVVRFRSIYLLSETFLKLRTFDFEFSLIALYDIKPLLVSCLTMQEATKSDAKVLRRTVSFVAYNVMILDNNGWDELSECILSLAHNNPLKAFQIILDLPLLYKDFVYRFLDKILDEAFSILKNPVESSVNDWTLALQTVIKIGVQLLDLELRSDLLGNILFMCVNSVEDLVRNGMENFVQRGLQDLEKFLAGDSEFIKYNGDQFGFVLDFALKISGLGRLTKKVAEKIIRISKVKTYDNPSATKSLKFQYCGAEFDECWFDRLQILSPVEILRIVMSTEMIDTSRELAYRRLVVLLSDHTFEKVKIQYSVFRELQELAIVCLWNERISENNFKILGQVVYHVAYEILYNQSGQWPELVDYIVTHSKTNFSRAVYIFQCMKMPLHYKMCLAPILDSLFQEILRWLEPPQELLVDNNCWVLAFVGAFCASIHLAGNNAHIGDLKVIANQMISSVRNLVERGMEVGTVRRAFRDLETNMEALRDIFTALEYRFFKGFIWRLYMIKGMSMESKIILWRINLVVEKVMVDISEDRSMDEFDWLNQSKKLGDCTESTF